MALTLLPRWSLVMSLQDNNGKSASMQVYLPGGMLQVDAEQFVGDLAAVVDPISDAIIITATLSRVFVETDDALVAPPSSEVERKLLIPLGTAQNPSASSVEIPSPVFTIEQDGTDVPLPTSAALVALLDFLTNGRLLPGNGIVTHYAADITRAGTPVVVHRTRKARI